MQCGELGQHVASDLFVLRFVDRLQVCDIGGTVRPGQRKPSVSAPCDEAQFRTGPKLVPIEAANDAGFTTVWVSRERRRDRSSALVADARGERRRHANPLPTLRIHSPSGLMW